MKLRSTAASHETFNAELTTDHLPSIPGPLAIKRLDTSEFIPLRDILGVGSQKYQLLEVSPSESARLEEVGITIAANVADLQDWYKKWDGPK
jgi:hypothetical protein